MGHDVKHDTTAASKPLIHRRCMGRGSVGPGIRRGARPITLLVAAAALVSSCSAEPPGATNIGVGGGPSIVTATVVGRPSSNPVGPIERPESSAPSSSEAPTSSTTTALAPTSTSSVPEPTVADDALASETASADPAAERGRLVINAVGDVNVDPDYIPALATNGYAHTLDGMGGLFLEDDLTVINLECPASEIGVIVPKEFNFRCDVDALPVIRDLGVDVANQGNNHSLDYGPDALLDSIANLWAADIAPVGAGANASEAHQAALFERNGWTIAVLGFGGVVPAANWIATDGRPGMADGDTVDTMVAAVAAAAGQADLVVVTIHWGKELQSGPPADDVTRARAMIEAGADMIFGHHPHRLNALETIDGVPVAWSLGNFVWPRLSAAGADTAVAQVIVEPDGTITACLLEVTIVSHGHPTLDDPAHRTC